MRAPVVWAGTMKPFAVGTRLPRRTPPLVRAPRSFAFTAAAGHCRLFAVPFAFGGRATRRVLDELYAAAAAAQCRCVPRLPFSCWHGGDLFYLTSGRATLCVGVTAILPPPGSCRLSHLRCTLQHAGLFHLHRLVPVCRAWRCLLPPRLLCPATHTWLRSGLNVDSPHSWCLPFYALFFCRIFTWYCGFTGAFHK